MLNFFGGVEVEVVSSRDEDVFVVCLETADQSGLCLKGKYPQMDSSYQSVTMPGVYFAGGRGDKGLRGPCVGRK